MTAAAGLNGGNRVCTGLWGLSVGWARTLDLLRRRSALRDAGQDPDEAKLRDAAVVERYLS